MEAEQLLSSQTRRDLLRCKFENVAGGSAAEEEDPLLAGQFEVIKQLCNTGPAAAEAKRKIDIVIDKCGPPPHGVGIQVQINMTRSPRIPA